LVEDRVMAYEVFQRTSVRVEQPALSFTTDGRIALNAAAVRTFRVAGIKFVLLLWDKPQGKLALKAAVRQDKNAYAVSIVNESHSGSLRAKAFLAHVGLNVPKRTMLPATWNDKDMMFEVTIPQEYLASKKRGESERKA